MVWREGGRGGGAGAPGFAAADDVVGVGVWAGEAWALEPAPDMRLDGGGKRRGVWSAA